MLPMNDSAKDLIAAGKSRPEKGNLYTADGRRFAVPLAHLENPIFIELLKMSEEEFGLQGNGPITLPCDGVFMDFLVSLVERCGEGFGHFHGLWQVLPCIILAPTRTVQPTNPCSWVLKKPFELHVKTFTDFFSSNHLYNILFDFDSIQSLIFDILIFFFLPLKF